jgi:hypothetical protein
MLIYVKIKFSEPLCKSILLSIFKRTGVDRVLITFSCKELESCIVQHSNDQVGRHKTMQK